MSTIWSDEESFQDRPDLEEPIGPAEIPTTPADRAKVQREAQARAAQQAHQAQRPTGKGTPPAPPRPLNYDVAAIESEEEDDFEAVLSDANLRLEQGTLYKMIMNHNLFEGMDADPRAIRNVEREMKRFARERMEIMLGMRQERQEQQQQVVVGSQFNSLEVTVLKQLAAAASKGATERPEADQIAAKIEKKTTLTPITAPKAAPAPAPAPKPLAQKPAAPIQRKPAPTPPPAADSVDPNDVDAVMNGKLKKPLHEMTPAEVEAHNREAAQRQRPRAKNPNAAPIPTGDQLYMLHATKQAQMDPKAANAISTVMALMNRSK